MNVPCLLFSIQCESGGTATPVAAQVTLHAVWKAICSAWLAVGGVEISPRFIPFPWHRM